jgi:hypothetical protein
VAWCAGALAGAQDQKPDTRIGWPCAGRPDPVYFRTAEATGGQFFMFHPSEVADSGALMAAATTHDATMLRAGGKMAPGLHEFTVPVDRVESLLFSVSVQCLQIAEIARPSGALLQASEPGVEYHQFEAGRIVTVAQPDPGKWQIRASGSGLFLVIVQARSALSLAAPRFLPEGPPRAGVQQQVRFHVGADVGEVQARLVTQGFVDVGVVPLRRERSDTWDEFVGEMTPPARTFRLVVSGRDSDGLPFQRVHAPLFDPTPRVH